GVTFDFNQDGKPDLAYGPINWTALNPSTGYKLFENVTPSKGHWIDITMHGKKCGREAIGTTLQVWERGTIHMKQVTTGGVFCSQNSLTQHFGIGDATIIDSIVIKWPNGQPSATIYNVQSDQRITITQG